MVKVQDLRIGNILFYHLTEDVCEVNFIGENSFDCKTKLGSMSHGVYDPIPLTEEWLLKFGFDYRNGYGFKKKDFDFISIKVADSIGYHFKCNPINVEVQYVHQLQNLYFALTGEELCLKP